MDKKWYYLIGGLLVVVVVISIIIPVTIYNKSKDEMINHEPIKIMNDEDFKNYKFPGIGLENDPYIIENYDITTVASSEDYAIFISSTTKYFIIRNCILEAAETAIHIENIAYGTANITRNICNHRKTWNLGDNSGIFLSNSSGVSITSNFCHNNTHFGIYLSECSDIALNNNNCSFNGDGYNYGTGIYLNGSSNVILTNNTCSNNYFYGIRFRFSTNVTLTDNTCNNNRRGIVSHSCSNTILIKNTCSSNIYMGISLSNSSNATLTDNICYNSIEYGIYLSYSSNTTLTSNKCNDNSRGIRIEYTPNTTLSKNICNNNDFGIIVSHSNESILKNNICSNNDNGILLSTTSNATLNFNLFEENIGYAIMVSFGSNYSIIYQNSFIDNNLAGTSQAEDDGTSNTWYDVYKIKGNYWSDWIGPGDYSIDGTANAVDPFPLISPPV